MIQYYLQNGCISSGVHLAVLVLAHRGGFVLFSYDGFASAGLLSGTDGMLIACEGNEERFTLLAAYDNLGKGASGAAVQLLNLKMGADISAGLVLQEV